MRPPAPASYVGPAVVVITRNRRDELVETLGRLTALSAGGEVSEVVVVDNASQDGTAAAVRQRFPGVRLLALPCNAGAVGRTVGVHATRAPVVAFADDDSWWEPGSLAEAARLFEQHPTLGLVHGRIAVDPEGRTDEACRRMALGATDPGLPGPSIITHLGCGAIVRRSAYLAVGGYSGILEFGGEERLLALDLAAAGWAQCYVDRLVAHHRPSARREPWPERWARYRRNDTLTALLRLPAGHAAGETAVLLRQAVAEPTIRRELWPFLKRLPAVAGQRRPVPDAVWHQFRERR